MATKLAITDLAELLLTKGADVNKKYSVSTVSVFYLIMSCGKVELKGLSFYHSNSV